MGPRVNLTFRWISQHITPCRLARVIGCSLPSGGQGSAEPDSWEKSVEEVEIWWSMLPLELCVDHARGERCHDSQCLQHPEYRLFSRSRARWTGKKAMAIAVTSPSTGTWFSLSLQRLVETRSIMLLFGLFELLTARVAF